MDMLVVVGTSVSYLYSSLALLLACAFPETGGGGNPGRPHLFLESPAMLLTFISLGERRWDGREVEAMARETHE